MRTPTYPSLYQINTRVLLGQLSQRLGRPATLDDVPDADLDRLANNGFDWVWFLGVWQTGPAGRNVSLRNPIWQREFKELLPDFEEKDVCGSCFAIRNYSAHYDFGGNNELASLADRIHERGMRLMLDFVPNHTAPDHPWVQQHPEYYVHGTQEQLAREPQNYSCVDTREGATVLAFGRDPYFPGWPDTFQLNYAEPALQAAMMSKLEEVAGLCDGVRCDMAMLILPEVFERTWGKRPDPFWPKAIQRVRSGNQDFIFMAEVYWDLEWTLQQQGFNYTYDKRLYDRLLLGKARPVRDHFRADMTYQQRSARFLENHDEPRAADVFRREIHKPAAVLTYLCPGLRFIHQGQMEGRVKRIPVHLGRGPNEATDHDLCNFYERLLPCIHRPEVREGKWQLLESLPAWDGNWTWDCFISFAWRLDDRIRMLVVVNYASNRSQCYLHLPFNELGGKNIVLKDLLGPEKYERSGDEILGRGLYIDLPAWGFNVFEVSLKV
jgi:glycosidase